MLKKSALSTYISSTLDKFGPGSRKVIGNMGWLFVDRIVRMGVGLFVGAWISRYLGVQQFGSFNFAIAFVALFGTVATLGLENIVVREIVHHPSKVQSILGSAFVLRVAAACCTAALSIASVRLIQPKDRTALLLVAIIAWQLIFQSFDTLDSYFQSQVQSKISVWARNISFLIFAAIKVVLIHFKQPLWTFAVAYSGEFGLAAIGMFIGYQWSGASIFSWKATKQQAMHLLKQSWPVLLSGMAIMLYMRIDMVMLKLIRDDTEVGIYAAATRISEVWYFIPSAIMSSVAPSIMRVKDSPLIYYSRIRRLFAIMTLTSYILGSLVALSSRAIVNLLYSASYAAAAPVLAIHIWAAIFVFLGVAQTPWDLSENLLRLSLYRTISGAIINIAINLLLLQRFGAIGAALATVVSYAASAVFANAFSAKTRPIFWMQMRALIPIGVWGKE